MTDESKGTVEVSRSGSVAIVCLKRRQVDNRVTQQMAELGAAAFEAARRDRTVTGCVLTGEGDLFCTGGDYMSAGGSSAGRLEFATAFNDLAESMFRLGKPLVAAIRGKAHAGGFSLVTACDMAVADTDATLGLPEAAHGLFPFLAMALVKDSLPKKVLFDMVYRARLLSADEALALYLVNEVVAADRVLPRAIELAACTSAFNPEIVSLGRDLYYGTRNLGPAESAQQARFALAAALKAMEEGAPRP
ncbi:MAG: enoyl-CoA hydratase/isomerase family protein [Pseudomonadota bacterium]